MDRPDPEPTPDQVTGANALFLAAVELKLKNLTSASGVGPPSSSSSGNPAVQALREHLWSLYPEFQRLFSALFSRQIGDEHSASVLRELQREPLQRYLYARQVMAPQLEHALRVLRHRMGRIEL